MIFDLIQTFASNFYLCLNLLPEIRFEDCESLLCLDEVGAGPGQCL